MHIKESGKVAREAGDKYQSIAARAIMLATGITICSAPSGIMCAGGGSEFSILSNIMLLIAPTV